MNVKFDDGRAYFSYTSCGGMRISYISVDEDWFNAHNSDNITAEELDKLAFEDRENSKAQGKISWWGLG